MSANPIRLGTRGSQLAMSQSSHVANRLRANGSTVEIIVIQTTGDVTDGPLTSFGGDGVFTKRLQNALLNRKIDLAVHSLKDLPTDPVEGLTIGAVPKREDPRDALIFAKPNAKTLNTLADLENGARIGTGSVRRRAHLLRLRDDLVVEDIRGNVDTRLAKLDRGDFDAVVLACAGLNRLELTDRISFRFSQEQLAPAVGQGALGLEIRANDTQTSTAIESLNDEYTRPAVTAERAMLNHLRAGCLAPVGAISSCNDKVLSLTGVVLSADGSEKLIARQSGPTDEPESIGIQVANSLKIQGAERLLNITR